LEEDIYVEFNSEFKMVRDVHFGCHSTYKYDTKNNLILTESSCEDGGQTINNKIVYKDGIKSRVYSIIESTSEAGKELSKKISTFKNGKLANLKEYVFENEDDSALYFEKKIKYDAKGRELKTSRLFWPGKKNQELYIDKFFYDQFGKEIKRDGYKVVNGKPILKKYEETEYSLF
jgi:hypothetical protein